MIVPVGPGEGALRAVLARDLEGERRQLRPPLGLGLDDFFDARKTKAPAVRVECFDLDHFGVGMRLPSEGQKDGA